MRIFVKITDGSYKWWAIDSVPTSKFFHTYWGRIGNTGSTKRKGFTYVASRGLVESSLIRSKINKGYVELPPNTLIDNVRSSALFEQHKDSLLPSQKDTKGNKSKQVMVAQPTPSKPKKNRPAHIALTDKREFDF